MVTSAALQPTCAPPWWVGTAVAQSTPGIRETEVDLSAKGRRLHGDGSHWPSVQSRRSCVPVCIVSQPRRLLSHGYMSFAYKYYLQLPRLRGIAWRSAPFRDESKSKSATPRKASRVQGQWAWAAQRSAAQAADREQGSVVISAGSRGARLSLSASPSPHFGPQSNLVSRFPTLNWS